jgi:hypothetical protein
MTVMKAGNLGVGALICLLGMVLSAAAPAAGQAGGDPLPAIRQGFSQAVHSPAAVEATDSVITRDFPPPSRSWPPVIQAYSAALEGLRGKHAKGLLDKYIHVQKAVTLMRGLPDDGSLEVLFLRFSFFHQIPPVFGVRSWVAPDLERLIAMLEERRYDEVPAQVQRDMAQYVAGCGEADASQRARLRRLDAELARDGEQ